MTRFSPLLLAFGLAMLSASPALAQTCTTEWANPVDGDFFTDANWTNGAPGAESTACITVPGTYTITLVSYDAQIGRIELGGASGTQTLQVGRLEVLGSGFVGENGRMEMLGSAVCDFCFVLGLHHITDTLLVEGVLKGTDTGPIIYNFGSGRIDIAPTGTLLLDPTGGPVEVGDALDANITSILLRGRLVLDSPTDNAPGVSLLRGDLVVDGGTIDVRDGQLNQGGLDASIEFRDATFNVAEGASFGFGGDRATILMEGTVGGDVQGSLGIGAGRLQAGPDDATLDFRGNGLVLNRFTVPLGFESLGGEFLNTGVLQANTFVYFSEVVFRNEDTLRLVGSIGLSNGAVIRNEVGGTLDGVDEAGVLNTGVDGHVENFGLLVSRLENRGRATQVFHGTLQSQPGSEIRVRSGVYFRLDPPASTAFPADVRVTGNGAPAFGSSTFQIEGTVSPGTDATPVDTLYLTGHVDFSSPAGSQQLVLDVDAGGVSDFIQHLFFGGGGAMTLGGTLVVRVRPGYTPQVGDTFTIMKSDPSYTNGQFDRVVADGAPEGIAFVAETSADRSTVTLRAIVGVDTEDGPLQKLALTAGPNPTRRALALRWTLPEMADVELVVVDLLGREVAQIESVGNAPAGTYASSWSAAVPAGVYIVRLRAGDELRTRRVTVLR